MILIYFSDSTQMIRLQSCMYSTLFSYYKEIKKGQLHALQD